MAKKKPGISKALSPFAHIDQKKPEKKKVTKIPVRYDSEGRMIGPEQRTPKKNTPKKGPSTGQRRLKRPNT